MLILGWHGDPRYGASDQLPDDHTLHDASAVLVDGGRIVAAIEEERLDRIKHSKLFPARAIRFCLDQARADLRDVDAIVTDQHEASFDRAMIGWALRDARRPIMSAREGIAAAFERYFDADVTSKIRFCGHHLAHLHGAWHTSGFTDALAVCFDGDGDNLSGMVALCGPSGLQILRRLTMAQSLGNFYDAGIALIGYGRFDEYKVMGLAPYGNPDSFATLLDTLCHLQPEGQFELNPAFHAAARLIRPRRKGEPFTQAHKDFAAALQRALERMVEHVVEHFKKRTGSRRLCLSGGVAHNSSMNGRLLCSSVFEQVFVSPAAHDAGNALGAALWVLHETGISSARAALSHVYLGSAIGESGHIGNTIGRWAPMVVCRRASDSAAEAAQMIADGRVLGWVQGRSEFGPRALGNRSILADPRPASNKATINAMVKKREAYRPFAPAVLEEHLHEWFDVPEATRALPFMVFVVPVRPDARQLLGAVTHVDGTARVQSISKHDNPLFHALVTEFYRRTGVPMVLNTSFNNHAEPIVDSIDDAAACFLTTDIHVLIVGDWMVEKVPDAMPSALLECIPALSTSRKLVRSIICGERVAYAIEANVPQVFAAPSVAISEGAFRVLSTNNTKATIAARCLDLGLTTPTELDAIASELLELWRERAIAIDPPGEPRSPRPTAAVGVEAYR